MIVPLDSRRNRLFLGGETPGGSLKYHLMRHLVKSAARAQTLRTVADLSTGSSAVALATVARDEGLQACVYVPDTLSQEYRSRLERLEATVISCPLSAIGNTLNELQHLHLSGQIFWTRQNYDASIAMAYRDLAKTALAGQPPVKWLVAGVGTGGSLHSFAQVLRELYPSLQVIAVYSNEVNGLRPSSLCIDIGDMVDRGARKYLAATYGSAVQFHTILQDDLASSRTDLERHGFACGDSTAAVWQVIRDRGLTDALGISMEGRRRP